MLYTANTRIFKPIKHLYQIGDPIARTRVQGRLTEGLLLKQLIFWTTIAVLVSFSGISILRPNLLEWHSPAAGSRSLSEKTVDGKALGEEKEGGSVLEEMTFDGDRPDLHDTFVPRPNQPPVFTRGFGTR